MGRLVTFLLLAGAGGGAYWYYVQRVPPVVDLATAEQAVDRQMATFDACITDALTYGSDNVKREKLDACDAQVLDWLNSGAVEALADKAQLTSSERAELDTYVEESHNAYKTRRYGPGTPRPR